jgi:16S rRNA (guanine966-N2)-methyltransferase
MFLAIKLIAKGSTGAEEGASEAVSAAAGAVVGTALGAASTGFFLKNENMETFYNAVYSMKSQTPALNPAKTVPSEVRIIGGTWKRSKLSVPAKPGLRPTPDRVRETLFNWLGQDLAGLKCVDAFAGSGALGFEAASRGAADVLLIEQDAALVANLQAHKTRLKAESIRIQRGDGISSLRSLPKASIDVIFIDPPFDAGLFSEAITAAAHAISEQGVIYLESPVAFKDDMLAAFKLRVIKQGKAGAVHFHLLSRL